MKEKITIEDFEKMNIEDVAHGQEVIFPHNFCLDYYEETNDDCDGDVYWELVMEGLVCTKCNLYTGIK